MWLLIPLIALADADPFGRREGSPVRLSPDSAGGVGADWAPVDIFHNSTDGGDPWIVLCKIDWAKYNEDPLGAGTFNKIVIKAGCTGELAAARRRWIRGSELEAAIASCPAAGSGKPGAPILPSGFVFHESRCGSTLAANMLGGVPGAMVLAEPPPLWAVLLSQRLPVALPLLLPRLPASPSL